jgi:hypothetical protein
MEPKGYHRMLAAIISTDVKKLQPSDG